MLTIIFFILAVLLIVGIAMGLITVPDPTLCAPTTTPTRMGGTFKSAMTGPGPVRIAATGTNGPLIALIERTRGETRNKGYWGYAITGGVDVGSVLDEEPVGAVHGCIVGGFAGVVPASPVFVDSGAVPSPLAAFSGLTHVDPADGCPPVGVGVTTTKIYFYPLSGAASVEV